MNLDTSMNQSVVIDMSAIDVSINEPVIDVSCLDVSVETDTIDDSGLDVSCSTVELMMDIIDYPIVLNLYVDCTMPELVEKYKTHIQKHNKKVSEDPFPDSGFDLFVPQEFWTTPDKSSVMVNHRVKCEMVENDQACAFFSFPRSSISKTPLLLANHTGIIDSGYRGFLFGAFRNLSNISYKTEEGIRLLQICHPSLRPFKVRLIENEDTLSTSTRGSGGFGSTGA